MINTSAASAALRSIALQVMGSATFTPRTPRTLEARVEIHGFLANILDSFFGFTQFEPLAERTKVVVYWSSGWENLG